MNKLIEAYENYIKYLQKHMLNMVGLNVAHGWNGTSEEEYLQGELLREEIEEQKQMEMLELPTVTRVETISHLTTGTVGRVFTAIDPNMKVELSLQDEKRTLKVFLSSRKPK